MKNLGDLIDNSLDLNKEAIIDTGRFPHRSYSYLELFETSNAVASALFERQFPRGSRIVIMAENSFEFIATYLGILKAGYVAVLVSYKYSKENINKIIISSGAKLVFIDRNSQDFCPEEVESINFENQFNGFLKKGAFKSVMPVDDEVAIYMYTSGSTGEPKGVAITHKSHLWLINKKINSGGSKSQKMNFRKLVASPIYHMSGLTNIETVLASHATLVLMSKFEAKEFATNIQKHRVNYLIVVPSMLSLLFKMDDGLQKLDFSSVKFVYMASAPASEHLIKEIKKRFPNAAGRIFTSYGLTEIGAGLFGRHPSGLPTPELSVGYPAEGIDFRIIKGVLQIRSPSMLKEYLFNKEDNKKSFTEDGYYITNDRFSVDENGFYYFDGRSDDMFVCGGFNVYPLEIEKILEKHPCVELAYAVGVTDEIKGHKPCAYVVTKQGLKVSEEELKNFFLSNAPVYLHPRRIWRLAQVPLTPLGKPDRSRLITMAEELFKNTNFKEDIIIEF